MPGEKFQKPPSVCVKLVKVDFFMKESLLPFIQSFYMNRYRIKFALRFKIFLLASLKLQTCTLALLYLSHYICD
jgi:hypothetical protein